jgi:hypothetical protein
MAYAQKPDFVFRRNGRVHLSRRGRQFTRLLASELCTSACRVCTAHRSLCSAVMWRLLVTYSILLFPLHFSTRTSPCAITFQLHCTVCYRLPGLMKWTTVRDPTLRAWKLGKCRGRWRLGMPGSHTIDRAINLLLLCAATLSKILSVCGRAGKMKFNTNNEKIYVKWYVYFSCLS